MKSNEFIIEDVSVFEVEQFVNRIKQDCQPFLKQANGRHMYRGLGNATKPFMGKSVRLTNRKPKDVPIIFHDMINTYFTKKFGAPFRNAMFCSSMLTFADYYGNIYSVYPIGDFEFVWSSEVEDLYMELDEIDPDYKKEIKQLNNTSKIKATKQILNVIKDSYSNSNLQGALDSGNEIMIRCNSYYAVANKIVQDPMYNFERLMNEK